MARRAGRNAAAKDAAASNNAMPSRMVGSVGLTAQDERAILIFRYVSSAMTRLNLEIVLPDALAQQAREAGLLEPNAVEEMVRRALLAKRAEKLDEARTVLAANPLPPMTSEEIQAEIDAYRSEVRRAARP